MDVYVIYGNNLYQTSLYRIIFDDQDPDMVPKVLNVSN
jgi:hypothetical protein